MHPGADHDHDAPVRYAGPVEPLEQSGQEIPVRDRPRDVRDRDGSALRLLVRQEFGQGRQPDGARQSRFDRGPRVRQGRVALAVIPACRHYGLGLIPWSPLGGGLLGGAPEKHDTGRRTDEEFSRRVAEKRGQLEQYEDLCRELGHPPGEVALAWLLHNPIVTAPIIGPRTLEQLESAVRAASIELDQASLDKLDEIFPGPGGEAPVPYAW